jgi:uncharacterized lipoprotein
MYQKMIKILVLCLGISMLLGCGGKGWFQDRSEDYKEATDYPTIKIPANIQSHKFGQEYQIPGE